MSQSRASEITEEDTTDPFSPQIHLLHVENDEAFADLVTAFLGRESESFTVCTETDPEAALDALLGEEPGFDCVVSDYDMPKLDGLELLDLVRDAHPDLPFLLFTGKGSEEIASEAISLGVTDYLQKGENPDQYAVLANRITNAVEAYRTRRALRRGEQYRRQLYRITSEREGSSDRKIDRLLELGREYLGIANAHLTSIDTRTDRHEITRAVGSDIVEEGSVTDLSETYCRKAITSDDILGVANAPEQGWADDPAYQRWDIGCYVGGKIAVDGDLSGTVCFASRAPRDRPFTHPEKAFVDLLTQRINLVFERERYRQGSTD
jgi:DNA-binding NarL/FixJ family response regulator